jgi:hypothetical protein
MRTELGVVLRVYRPTAHCIHTAKRGRGCKEPPPLPTKNGRAPGIVCWGRLALTAVSLHLQFKCLARPGSHGETHLFDACCVTCLAALHMDRRAHMMERAACGRQDRRDRRCQASALSTAREATNRQGGYRQAASQSCLAARLRNANANAHARRHSIAQTGGQSAIWP